MEAPDKDPWADQVAIYETWPTEMLQARRAIFHKHLNDPLMQKNASWLARCIRPQWGLINILLLIRNA